MEVRALTWNLFHGRDWAPDPALHTWRSRLLGISERGATHAQVNRDLCAEFATVLKGAQWDVALLQECPPRWAEELADSCDAVPHLVLTSRNLPFVLSTAQSLIARYNPDLIASWEGGSNLTLIRGENLGPWRVAEREALTLTSRPERRRMAFTRLDSGLCIANLHASEGREAAEADVALTAERAAEWTAGDPLIFGGDLNLRPAQSAELFERLSSEHGLAGATGEHAIDHLLSNGLATTASPRQWPGRERDIASEGGDDELRIRLSDHAPVEATFTLPDDGDPLRRERTPQPNEKPA